VALNNSRPTAPRRKSVKKPRQQDCSGAVDVFYLDKVNIN
jgi:hypothetical protein